MLHTHLRAHILRVHALTRGHIQHLLSDLTLLGVVHLREHLQTICMADSKHERMGAGLLCDLTLLGLVHSHNTCKQVTRAKHDIMIRDLDSKS